MVLFFHVDQAHRIRTFYMVLYLLLLRSSILWWDKKCQSFAETIYEVHVKQSFEDGEKDFDRLSIEERGKFDEETLFNVNNIKRKMSSRRQKETGSRNEYIV
ncbi:myelin-associated oligodendrocyte basic protein, partial [Thalictrum thalictroides]